MVTRTKIRIPNSEIRIRLNRCLSMEPVQALLFGRVPLIASGGRAWHANSADS